MDDNFAEDGLLIDENTDPEEVKDFLKRRTKNPYEISGSVIYNFNSHKIDEEALERAVSNLNGDFLIPYQVTGTWGFMYHMLPDSVKQAEILVYHPGDEEYYDYQNFYPRVPNEVQEEFRHQLSRLADQHH